MTISWELIISVVSAVFGSSVLTTLIQYKLNKNKANADTADVLVKSIMDWATKLSSRIDKLESEVEERDKKIDSLIEELHQKDLLIQDLSLKVDKLERNGNKK